jgi:hypothetical protein
MKQKRESAHKFAVCVSNADYPVSLEMHKIYRILPDEDAATDGDIRVIDESGEDYLYPAEIVCRGRLTSSRGEIALASGMSSTRSTGKVFASLNND